MINIESFFLYFILAGIGIMMLGIIAQKWLSNKVINYLNKKELLEKKNKGVN